MRARAMLFTVGLLTGGAAVYVFFAGADSEPVRLAQNPESVEAAPSPADVGPVQAQLDAAFAEIAVLQSEIEALRVEIEAKEREYRVLNEEVARLRQRLAEESEARVALERKLSDSERAAETAPAVSEPVEPPAPPPEDAPPDPVKVAGAESPPAAEPIVVQGDVHTGTGEFVLQTGDAWVGDGGGDVFEVLNVSPADDTQLDRAEVNAFGERGVVEQGAQVSRMMPSGLYTLIVTRVNGKTGVIELLVEREG